MAIDVITLALAKRKEEALLRKKDFPKITFIGNNSGMTKDNTVDLELDFNGIKENFKVISETKWQGTSSIAYPKKNYTIKLYTDNSKNKKANIDVGWGNQNKYCLKADYMDASHSRNNVSAKIWGEIVATRKNPTPLFNTPNYGAIDGFITKGFMNNKYIGLFNWNIPKDGWMFNVNKDDPNHAFVVAETHTDACAFREPALIDGSDWTLEFPKSLRPEILDSFNAAINHVKDTSDAVFKEEFENHFDLEAAIDYFIYSYVMCHIDGLAKNLIMVTYDGVRWIPSMYDMDSTWGLHFTGTEYVSYAKRMPEQYNGHASLLWQRVKALFPVEIFNRYAELRKQTLSYANIVNHFSNYMEKIPKELYEKEKELYPDIPSTDTNNIEQIMDFVWYRIRYVDNEMRKMGNKKNLFDKINLETGVYYEGYNGGKRVKNGDYNTTDFITINEWQRYTFSGNNAYGHLNYFDKDRVWLAGAESSASITLQAPDNTAFVKLSWHKNNTGNLQLELSKVVTEYEQTYMF